MRQIIIIVAALCILGGSFFVANQFANSKKPPREKKGKVVKTVFVETVKNDSIAITISESGNLVAKNKISLYSEVQGLVENAAFHFRVGNRFKKGANLLTIDSQDYRASLIAQKSTFQKLLVTLMPDLQMDYPESHAKWKKYLENIKLDGVLPELPKVSQEKERFFMTGKNVYSSYYALKNLEINLENYTIKAPFDGVVTEAAINAGALIRPGQLLGEFIDTSVFEVPLSVNASYATMLQKGKEVQLSDLDNIKSWIGKVSRINGKIEKASQTIVIYVEVKGKDLLEGMYVRANIAVKDALEAYEIPRKLLVENKAVYILENSKLKLLPIQAIHFNENTVVVKGLTSGMRLISKPVPGGFEGMTVKVYGEDKPMGQQDKNKETK
ncbi:efflux RND transporter periplasmic adaptor subunit [Flavicella sediminum]|uniref:efflux RND transporter periplasmic adaptor subunit n=1 Tax=Flavicella sediminum TaxID=2585141 RepID=UPI00111DAFE0|nr:efflux RND transporter periplasmic adaptor subunit [Flavicella sediminum]